jgi:hypothetical protein
MDERQHIMTLDEIAHREKNPELWTDKKSATPGFLCHDYLRLYEREFSKWRDGRIQLLEIGVNKGASVKLWLEYFPNASVYGVDIKPFKNEVGIPPTDRFRFFQGNQSDPSFWNVLFGQLPDPFLDIIIDDGCHFSGPIHITFNCLWSRVKPGGCYVVEDINEVLNPDSHTPGYPNQLEFVENLVGPVILGGNDVAEMIVSKDVCLLKKMLGRARPLP